jgi:cell division protein FtsN
MFSGSFLGINTNLTTYALFIGDTDPYVYSNFSLGLRLPGNITIMPQAQYGYSRKEFISSKLIVEKRIREKAFLNFSYEHNFNNNLNMAEFGFRFNFDFAQTGFSVRQSNNKTSFIEYARGSLIYDRKTKYLGADNQFNVGKGCISVIPFLDLNANGLRDRGEPKAYGLNLRANGGRVEKSEKDTTILILGLEPYTNCFIDLDANSFENISWRMPVQVLSVSVDPEIVKHIEIPVTVVGEASGSVLLEKKGEAGGLGRIIVSFFTKDNKLVGSTLTEDDGYFSWFGFNPGQYRVAIDTSQMRKLAMISVPGSMDFSITGGREGDLVDGLDFRLTLIESDTIVAVIPPVQKVITKDTSVLTIHEIFEELTTITKDSYAIQLGAFRNRGLAENFRRNLEKITGRKLEVVAGDDGFFKVRINNIPERREADEIISALHKNGLSVLWIVTQKVKQQQVVLVERERQDTVVQIFESKIFLPFREDFYKLDISSNHLIEQTVVKAIERQSPKLKNMEIAANIRVTREEPFIPAVVGRTEAAERTEVTLDKVDVSFVSPDLVTPLSKMMTPETAPVIHDIPEISLQVGIFYKRSEAMKARRLISAKLDLPVKITRQWEYFRVIIIGFSSREETIQYYPELAGLGYPNITLIEE